eukprot:CAMPEP_0179308012 /NCGR_PEP_ID=MMETSP0797-20121207/50931_1 /TAXON_ID=47934 /ORGANISM="Dinophysis acuminata, Strain DAEP01" /LENGTH=75 /DNA_ID=CAMNT_0021017701 /DNA_START=21 /DNA_END=245 /DNA_ORIENTATION=-
MASAAMGDAGGSQAPAPFGVSRLASCTTGFFCLALWSLDTLAAPLLFFSCFLVFFSSGALSPAEPRLHNGEVLKA